MSTDRMTNFDTDGKDSTAKTSSPSTCPHLLYLCIASRRYLALQFTPSAARQPTRPQTTHRDPHTTKAMKLSGIVCFMAAAGAANAFGEHKSYHMGGAHAGAHLLQ